MEAINRQSAVHSIMNRDHYFSPTKGPERDLQQHHSSGTAPPLITPTSMYPSHPPPPYTHAAAAPQPASHPISGLISPIQSHAPGPRRMSSDVKEPPSTLRQSLPSIHEALYPPSNYASPRTTIDPPSARPYANFPQPPPTPTSRANSLESTQYPVHVSMTQPAHSSPPHAMHPSYARTEPMTPLYENSHHTPLPSIRTALPQQPPVHSGPGLEYLRQEKDARSMAPVANGYPPHPPHHAQHPSYTTAPPVSSATYSPQSPHPLQQPYRQRYEHEEHNKTGENPPNQKVYGPVVKRHLDYWDIEIELASIKNSSNELTRMSSRLLTDAQQNTHHGSMPERMPSLHDIDLMRVQHEKVGVALQRAAEMIHTQGQLEAGDQHGPPPTGKVVEEYSQEEMNWDESRNIGNYGGPDAKKRRGRAAPPGRCHSCNRAETPEWRRGPDGARTLCNACGLHYAKLTRKLGSKQPQNSASSLRPTSMGDGSARA